MGFYERKLFLIKIKMVLNCLEEVDVFKVLYFRMKEFVDKYLVMVIDKDILFCILVILLFGNYIYCYNIVVLKLNF